MYLVRVDNGNTGEVSQASLARQRASSTYRVSLSDMLAAARVVERVGRGGQTEVGGIFSRLQVRQWDSSSRAAVGEARGTVGHQKTRADGGSHNSRVSAA
jgi:hypothetical protein